MSGVRVSSLVAAIPELCRWCGRKFEKVRRIWFVGVLVHPLLVCPRCWWLHKAQSFPGTPECWPSYLCIRSTILTLVCWGWRVRQFSTIQQSKLTFHTLLVKGWAWDSEIHFANDPHWKGSPAGCFCDHRLSCWTLRPSISKARPKKNPDVRFEMLLNLS